MCKIFKTKLGNKSAKFSIGTKVFWNENKFTNNQIVHLIQKFGMEAMTVISRNGSTIQFECNNGIIEHTNLLNLKQI